MAIQAIVGYTSNRNQKKAAKEQRRASEIQRQRDRAAQQRQRSAAIRETRLAAARATQAAVNQGVAGSSGAQGGVGSIISQGTANISFLDQSARVGDQVSEKLGNAERYQQRARDIQAVGQLHQTVVNTAAAAMGAG
jgi:hypothetical protein